MSAAFRVKIVDRMARVIDAEKKGTARSLGHAAGALRKTVVRSIRRRRPDAPPSAPGAPPKTPTGRMRRAVRYAVDQAQRSASIGAVRDLHSQPDSAWALHEHGGRTRKRRRRLAGRTFAVGDWGPIRTDGHGRPTRIKLATEAQVARAAAVLAQANDERAADEAATKTYEPRPFMRPALEALQPTLPDYWKSTLTP